MTIYLFRGIIWKPIKRYEGFYEVSNFGRIKSLWFTSNKSKKRYRRGKILKPKTYKDKCSIVELYKEGKHKTYLVYRLELCAFTNVPYESKLTAQHIDGNRLNNNLSNLMWLTRGDNIRQGFVDGLYTSQIKTYVIDKLSNEK